MFLSIYAYFWVSMGNSGYFWAFLGIFGYFGYFGYFWVLKGRQGRHCRQGILMSRQVNLCLIGLI